MVRLGPPYAIMPFSQKTSARKARSSFTQVPPRIRSGAAYEKVVWKTEKQERDLTIAAQSGNPVTGGTKPRSFVFWQDGVSNTHLRALLLSIYVYYLYYLLLLQKTEIFPHLFNSFDSENLFCSLSMINRRSKKNSTDALHRCI